jgi:aromatic-L-amino-acid decarboxylase
MTRRNTGDMEPEEFRRQSRRVADVVADYLERLESFSVLPQIEPGDVRAELPAAPPVEPEPFEAVLADYERLIEPNVTHWQHPGFMAYFPSVASGPGILGEWLAAGLNSNVMFWKNAPASTELEQVVVSWLRQMLGLPDAFDGVLTDTASVSSLLALVAARHAIPGLDARDEGLAGRDGLRRLRLYVSTEAHHSIERAAVVIGVGRAGVRRIEADDAYRMKPESLERAIAEDRRDGWQPFCVVGTLGTTSSTSMDPAAALADLCEREKLWLHFDAAYGGAGALVPEKRVLFEGWERADSIVFNPHKMMFTPFDASLLLFRDSEGFRDAFDLIPEYSRYLGSSAIEGAHNYSEYGIQLGRRFRALKLWMMIRYFGVDGIAERIRVHFELASELAEWVEADPDWELLAPVPLSTVCLRFRPAPQSGPDIDEALDRRNESILEEVNRSGRIYLSSTRLRDRFAIRVALGNPRADRRHVLECWHRLQQAADAAGVRP